MPGEGFKVLKLAVEKINPAPYNPRKELIPGDPEYEDIKNSLMEFGLVEPLVWNAFNGVLVGGHQRFKILKTAGHKEVHVSVVHIDDPKREKALNMRLNKSHGKWDYLKLKEQLVELNDGHFDLTLTGFSVDEVEEMIHYQPTQAPEDRPGPTPEDKRAKFESATIKQIVLYYEDEDYTDMVGRLEKLRDAEGLADNSEAMKFLLGRYEKD